MPRPPGIIDRVNYVVDSWNNPCNAPWAVYVETALPAVLDAVIAVVCFDILDVIRFIFRPVNSRSGRHGGRGKKGKHGRKPKGIAQKIAAKLPPFARLQQRKVSQGVRTLWVIDGIGQRLLWWWLVVDIATAAAYNFTSILYKTEFCQMASSKGAALRQVSSLQFAAIIGWNSVPYQILRYQEGSAVTTPAGFSVGDGMWSIVASLDVENIGSGPQTVEIRITIIRSSGTEVFPGGSISLGVGGSGGLVMSHTGRGPFSGFVQVRPSFGFTKSDAGDLYLQGRPPVAAPPIEQECPIPFFGD